MVHLLWCFEVFWNLFLFAEVERVLVCEGVDVFGVALAAWERGEDGVFV